jgi:mRNA-degrading endonuclease RelE of RelBE toxin-antitoxin system
MTILLSPEFRKDVGKLPAQERKRIRKVLLESRDHARVDTSKIGEGLWRLRLGDYRVYYSPQEFNTYVLRLIHRSRAYRPETISALLRRISSLDQ